MKVIQGHTLTDSTLTSSTVTEADYAAWASGTTYAIDAYVIVTTPNIHKIYKSKQNSNVGNDPTTDTSETWWEFISYTNRWKMFNAPVQQQTVNSGGIAVVITPAEITTALALINTDCASVTILMVDPVEGTVFNQTYDMVSDSGITSWYDYFFTAIVRKTQLAVIGLPPYSAAVITVTLTDSSSASCGYMTVGTYDTIGDSQYGASFGIIDYSTKTTDSSGNVTVTAGNFSDRADVDVIIETGRFAQVKTVLTAVRSTPSVWVTEEDTEGTIIYGFFKEFDIIMTNPTVSLCTLQIEGLT